MRKKVNKRKRAMRVLSAPVIIAFFSMVCMPAGTLLVSADPVDPSTTAMVGADIKQVLPKPGNVTVNFKDVDINTVLNYLSEISGVDIIPSPGVSGKVTMRLRDKPWEVALDIVSRNYGYVYSREGDIIRVIPKGQLHAEESVTEVIPLNHIIRDIELVKEEATEDGSQVMIRERQESLDQVMTAVNSILDVKQGEKATYIPSANAIVVTAVPARINEIKRMVEKLDKKSPQILLDAKVLEITLTKDERLGVDWNAIVSVAGAARPTTFPFTRDGTLLPHILGSESQRQYYPYTYINTGAYGDGAFPYIDVATLIDPMDPGYGDAGSLFTYGTLDFSTFQATLSLLDQRGDTEILSSPRITTLNNQKATIKVIEKIMLQKTQETTQTAGIVTVEFEKEDEAREVGIKLTIMPHVNTHGQITVNLLPEVSNRVGSGFDVVQVGNNQNAIALTFSSREANTRVRVKDGDTIFIGGLIRENTVLTDNKFPVLGDLFSGIPLLGNVFRYEAEDTTKTEIVFFVTVHLLKDSMESVQKSNTGAHYNRFFGQDNLGGETPPAVETGPSASLMTGRLNTENTTMTMPVNGGASGGEEVEKGYKPFLDFRKKQ